MTKFVLCAQGRSGSWWLTELLNQHPHVFCAGEVFHFEFGVQKQYYRQATGQWPGPQREHALNGDLDAFLFDRMKASKLVAGEPSAIAATGFKQIYEHLELPMWSAKLAIEKASNLRIIHLYRENPFECMASWWLAVQTQNWFGRAPQRKVTINITAACRYLEHRKKQMDWVDHLGRMRGLTRLSYDVLRTSTREAVADLHEFLDIDRLPQSIPSEMLRPKHRTGLSHRIENIKQLRDYFSGTEYAPYLKPDWQPAVGAS